MSLRARARRIGWPVVLALLCCAAAEPPLPDHYSSREVRPQLDVATGRRCLSEASRLRQQVYLSAAKLLRLYQAEVCVGRFGVGFASLPAREFDDMIRSDEPRDATYRQLMVEVRAYIAANRSGLRQISDGWKDEAALWEPDDSLLRRLRDHPDSEERWEVEWDQAWKGLTRRYSFSEWAKGKSCQEYYDAIIAQDPEAYRGAYSVEDVAERVSDCERRREQFQVERAQVEREFAQRPARKERAFDPEPTEVISGLYFGLC